MLPTKFLFCVDNFLAKNIVKTQRNSKQLALELDTVVTCSTTTTPTLPQTFQTLLNQLESCNLAQTLIALGFDN